MGSTFTSITNTGCNITGVVSTPVQGEVVTDFENAYAALDAQNPTCDGSVPITSTVLAPGVYCSAAGTIIGTGVTLTLDGSATDVWVFKIGTGGLGALTANGLDVVMSGSADACNVYWWTAESTTLTDSHFKGTVLSGAAFTMTRGNLEGRAFAGDDATVTDASPMQFAGCAPPATITVEKVFSDANPDSVLVELNCTSGTVEQSPLNASQAEPAVFLVGGAAPGTSCTATEQVPAGYTEDQSDCVAVALGGECTIFNTRIPEAVTVRKDFSDNNPDPVLVELVCSSGTVDTTPLNAAEGSPAVFLVNNANPGTICMATEQVPAGYTEDQSDCVAVALGGECTIFNTRIPEAVTVHKDFSDNNPDPVLVELVCSSGTVDTTPLNAAEGSPAVFLVNNAGPGTICMATEQVPAGYTEDQSDCVAVALGGECTIFNTRIPEAVTVHKDFSDNNPDPVLVELVCSSGTVDTTPLNAAEGSPAVFLVNNANPGTICTATEQVPAGYTEDQSDCVAVALGGECTIFNTRNPEAVTVHKDFSDNNPDPVLVELVCSSGTVDTTPLNAAEGSPAVFLVNDANPGTSCMATEQVPAGYTEDQSDCVAVALGGECTIFNTRIPEAVTVRKDFSDNNTDPVLVELVCSSGTVETTPLNASEASPAVFLVNNANPGTICMATEQVPAGYTEDQSDCVAVALGGECTIFNTRIPEAVTVHKDFSDNNPDPVLVELVCSSGTVDTTPLNAAEGSPAVFLVNNANPGTICMATEQVPAGYTEDQSDCVAVALGGECTIFNTRIPAPPAPAPVPVPTLSAVSMATLAMLFALLGFTSIRRRSA